MSRAFLLEAVLRDAKSKPLVGIISLGCAKNLIDTERLLGEIGGAGFTICAEAEDAGALIINTCAFIESARAESYEAIEYALSLKKSGSLDYVIVAGCMPQRYREELLKDSPGVDAIVGVYGQDEIPGILEALSKGGSAADISVARTFEPPPRVSADTGRLRLTPRHFAYLRISEGCDNRCSYCVIPDIRGPLRSKPLEEVAREAEELAADGAREIILVGQDTTSYGRDIYETYRLPELLARVAAVDSVRWVRLLYTHPAHYRDEFVRAFSEIDKLLPYLDVPVQHASDSVLARMGRGLKRRDLDALFQKLRREIDGIVLRTSVIVGFPGETERDFEELLEFLKAVRFDRLGAFTYSKEAGTPAALLDGHLSEGEKNARLEELMLLQQKISREINRGFVGGTLEAIVDEVSGKTAICRSCREAPDVDGVLRLEAADAAVPGGFVRARITGAGPYDLEGVIV